MERFDKDRMAFLCIRPNNPHGAELRAKFKARTGYSHYLSPLPYEELDYEDRIGRALSEANCRVCQEYDPLPLDQTRGPGRLQVSNRAWMSRLMKLCLLFGAGLVGITKLDQHWVYQGVEITHPYAIVCPAPHQRGLLSTAPSYFAWPSGGDAYSRLKNITTNPWIAIAWGLVAGVGVTPLVGPLFVKLRSDYFTLVNLAFCVIMYYFTEKILKDVTQGDNGLFYIDKIDNTALLNLGNPKDLCIMIYREVPT